MINLAIENMTKKIEQLCVLQEIFGYNVKTYRSFFYFEFACEKPAKKLFKLLKESIGKHISIDLVSDVEFVDEETGLVSPAYCSVRVSA
jgi:hypothetical protein